MADYTQGVDQVSREAPYIEAAKAAQMTGAKSLVDSAAARAAGYVPGQFLNPDYEVAGLTQDQTDAIAKGRLGIGAYQPYMNTADALAKSGQTNLANAATTLTGADTRGQFTAARDLINKGASAGIPFPAAYMGTTADKYGGASAGSARDATSQGYTASTYGGASAGSARDATSQGYTATAADRIGANAATLAGAPTAMAQTTGYNPRLINYQMGGPERVNTRSFTDQGTAGSYMSPYMQNVVDIQQREAQRQADIAATQQQSAATRSGAFGGGRDAIMRAEAARNLALQKGDIQAQGQQAAYQQAQQQFNAEQGYGLQGQIANQQAGLTQGQQNLGANLGVQQLGVQTGLQTSLANLSNQQQAELANQALKGQYGLTQGQMSQQANMQTSSQAQQAALQNAALASQASQFGSGAANQAQLANAQEANRMAQYNASNLQQAGLQNAALASQASQFGAAAGNQAQLANAAASNQMAQYNAGNLQQAGLQNAALGSQANQFGSAAYNQAALVNAQRADQMAQFNANASQQAGLGLGSLAAQQFNIGNSMAQGLGSLGTQQGNLATQSAGLGQLQQGLGQQDVNFLYNLGSAQKSQTQAELDAERQNTLQKNMQPYQQLGFLSDIYKGAPTTQMGTTMTAQAAPSPFQQAAGLGIGAITAAAGAKKLGLGLF